MTVRDVPRDLAPGEESAASTLGASELVGRDEELGRLRTLVHEVAAGRGRSVWVDGEPGIGKSALLAAGLADVERLGCQLFAARADEAGAVFPLRLLLDALGVRPDATDLPRAGIAERLWGRNATGVAGPDDRVAAAAELLLILIDRLCASSPIALVADDLQWADVMSLAVWGRLHRATRQLPLLLVAATRPVPRREEVIRLRQSLAGTDAVVLRLEPLTNAQVTTLVDRLVSAPPGSRLQGQVGQAGGNPLYVRELVDALIMEHRIEVRNGVADLVADDVTSPASLAAAIAGRLSFLTKPAIRVLRMATLFGGQFRVQHLSALAGPDSDLAVAITEGLAAGVLTEAGPTLAFRHPLIRQALYETLPSSLRSALHRQAAQALDAAGEPVEKVAEQLLAAPQAADAWVVGWLTGAAPTLIYRAPGIAVDLLQRVRPALDSTDPRRTQLDSHLVTVLCQLGRYHEVEALARPLLAGNLPDPELAGQVAWALAYALRALRQFEQALAVTEPARAARGSTHRWDTRLRALRAALLVETAHYDEARRMAVRAEADGEQVGDRFAVGWALFAMAGVQSRHDQDQAAALHTFERATAVLEDEPEATDLRLVLLADRASALRNLGSRPEADRVIGQALAMAERAGTPQRLATLRVQAAEICFAEGRWDDALAEVDAATDLAPHDPTRLRARGLAALIAIHRDDRATATTLLRGHEDRSHLPGSLNLADTLSVARALAAERDGQPKQALARLLEEVDPGSTRQFPQLSPDRCLWLTNVVRLALAAGDEATARAAARAGAAEADRHRLPAMMATAHQCRGLVDADPPLLRSAADGFDRAGYVLYRARALEDAAVLLAQRGEVAAARSAYAEALDIYTDLEAEWDIRRADARLRPLGIRRGVRGSRRRSATGWEALTPTEVRIAHLVEAGKSNPDIAAELFLSRNTVQTHVSHILTKLNVRSRMDIARQAMSQRAGP